MENHQLKNRKNSGSTQHKQKKCNLVQISQLTAIYLHRTAAAACFGRFYFVLVEGFLDPWALIQE